MQSLFTRSVLFAALAVGTVAIAHSTPPPPPPPPPPFDDPAIAQEYEAWERNHGRLVSDAAKKLARARIAIRGETCGTPECKKQAAREFAVARKSSLASLHDLAILFDKAKPAASGSDLQRLEDRLKWGREWFSNTEYNTLEILAAISK